MRIEIKTEPTKKTYMVRLGESTSDAISELQEVLGYHIGYRPTMNEVFNFSVQLMNYRKTLTENEKKILKRVK